jgi:hypothetical protein
MAKIDNDGANTIKIHIRGAMETLANEAEKAGTLNAIQPQLEHIFKLLFDIEHNWERIDDKK